MPETKTKRRWFRFSLRTLFVFVLLICVMLGVALTWLRTREAEFERQTVVAKALEYHRANVKWEPQLPEWLSSVVGQNVSSRITWVFCQTDADVNGSLDLASQLPNVTGFMLTDGQLTDDVVNRLASNRQLNNLSVNMVSPQHYGDSGRMGPTNNRYTAELQTRLPNLSITWFIIPL